MNEDHIRDIARRIAQETPTVVLAQVIRQVVRFGRRILHSILNILLGSVGRRWIVARRALPSPTGDQAEMLHPAQIQDVPDGSIRVLHP